MRHLVGVVTVLALLATACGEGAERMGGETSGSADAVEVGGGEGTAPGPTGNDGGSGAPPWLARRTISPPVRWRPCRPARWEVDVRIVGATRLELAEVREATGWTHRVDDVERAEIEIDFRCADGRELELEHGRLQVDVG